MVELLHLGESKRFSKASFLPVPPGVTANLFGCRYGEKSLSRLANQARCRPAFFPALLVDGFEFGFRGTVYAGVNLLRPRLRRRFKVLRPSLSRILTRNP